MCLNWCGRKFFKWMRVVTSRFNYLLAPLFLCLPPPTKHFFNLNCFLTVFLTIFVNCNKIDE